MQVKNTFILGAAAMLTLSTSAYAVTTEHGGSAQRVVQKHHVAHYHKPGTASDVPQETLPAAAPPLQPAPEPGYFGPARGSAG